EPRRRNTPLARSLVELRTPRGVEPQRKRLCLFSYTDGSARTRGSKMGTGVAFFELRLRCPTLNVFVGELFSVRSNKSCHPFHLFRPSQGASQTLGGTPQTLGGTPA